MRGAKKGKHSSRTSETVSEVVEWVGASWALFNKVKNAVLHRKSRR
jgi:hypothetical protein